LHAANECEKEKKFSCLRSTRKLKSPLQRGKWTASRAASHRWRSTHKQRRDKKRYSYSPAVIVPQLCISSTAMCRLFFFYLWYSSLSRSKL